MLRLLEGKTVVWLAIAAQIGATFAMLWPAPELPDLDVPMADKWAHFVVFGMLYFLWASALKTRSTIFGSGIGLILCLLFYGIIIEVLQENFYTSRTGDLMDVVANSVGILLGLIVFNVKEKLYLQKG